MPPIWKNFWTTLDAPPILVGHSMGGLLAQMLAARREDPRPVLLAPSAPWGVPPATLFEIASAQAMLLNVGFWNSILKPDEHVAGRHSLDRCAAARTRGDVRALCAGIGPRHFRDHALGPGHGPRQ